MNMSPAVQKACSENILSPERHRELIKNMKQIAREANIPEQWVCKSMRETCVGKPLDYIKGLKTHEENDILGLAFVGPMSNVTVQDKMMLMTAACLRNYINARVMTVQDVLSALKADAMPDSTVLFISNFFFGKTEGGSIAEWQVSNLLGLLYKRQAEGLQTVVYVSDLKRMGAEYGAPFKLHMEQHFVLTEA